MRYEDEYGSFDLDRGYVYKGVFLCISMSKTC